jgi:hypothetical protein
VQREFSFSFERSAALELEVDMLKKKVETAEYQQHLQSEIETFKVLCHQGRWYEMVLIQWRILKPFQ